MGEEVIVEQVTPGVTEYEPITDTTTAAVDIDVTEELSDQQIVELFAAFETEDWAEVDAIIDGIELPESKAGGLDRNRGGAEKLRRYWTTGPGGAKIGWGTSGDWTRCVALLSKYLGPRARGYCNLRHKERTGMYPGDKNNKSVVIPLATLTVIDPTTSTTVPTSGGGQESHFGLSMKVAFPDDPTPTFVTTPDVLSVGDCFKVIGPDTVTYTAQVVDFKSIGDGAKSEFVGDSVNSSYGLAVVTCNASIPFGTDISGEQPTGFRLICEKSESFVQGQPFIFDGNIEQEVTTVPVSTVEVGATQVPLSSDLPAPIDGTDSFNVGTGTASTTQGVTVLLEPSVVGVAPPSGDNVGSTASFDTALFDSHGAKDIASSEPLQTKYDTAMRKKMAAKGHAMKDGSYPIGNKEDLRKAIHAVGRGNADHDAIRRHIMKRAKALQCENMIPDDWKSDGSKTLMTDDAGYSVKDSHIQGDVMPTDVADTPLIEHKAVGVKGINVVDDQKGIVTTIISVTGVKDRVNDRIHPGAYEKTLAQRTPKGIWSHDWNEPVSRTLSVKELMPGDSELPATQPNGQPWPPEAGGLQVKTQFNLDTQRGREAFSDVVFFGDEQEWSIGYHVPVGGAKVDPQSGVRDIYTLDLYEYSPVLFGAMSLARTTSVKDAQTAFQTFKKSAPWMQEAGDRNIPDEAEVTDNPAEEAAETAVQEALEQDGRVVLTDDQLATLNVAIGALYEFVSMCKSGFTDDMELKGGNDWSGYDNSSSDESGDNGDSEGSYDSSQESNGQEAPDNSSNPVTEPTYSTLSEAADALLSDGIIGRSEFTKLSKLSGKFDDQMVDDDPTKMRDVTRDIINIAQNLLGHSDGRDVVIRMYAQELAGFINQKRQQEVDQVDPTNLQPTSDHQTPEPVNDPQAQDTFGDTKPSDNSGDSSNDVPPEDSKKPQKKSEVISLTEIKALEDSIKELLNS